MAEPKGPHNPYPPESKWSKPDATTIPDRLLGRLQTRLQGHGYPPPYRPWIAVWLGNKISDLRYWKWTRDGHEL